MILLLDRAVSLVFFLRYQASVLSLTLFEKWLLALVADKIRLISIKGVIRQKFVLMNGNLCSLVIALLLLLLHSVFDLGSLGLLLSPYLPFIV